MKGGIFSAPMLLWSAGLTACTSLVGTFSAGETGGAGGTPTSTRSSSGSVRLTTTSAAGASSTTSPASTSRTSTATSSSTSSSAHSSSSSSSSSGVPISLNACGYNLGGQHVACGAGVPCCVTQGLSLECGPSTSTCKTTTDSNPVTALFCEDSSECPAGYLCCLTFTPNVGPFMAASCRQASYCGGIELCRTESTSPCSGSTNSCTAANSNWNTAFQLSQLGAGLGFCKTPTCGAYQQSCSANADCCSGSCDIGGYFECN